VLKHVQTNFVICIHVWIEWNDADETNIRSLNWIFWQEMNIEFENATISFCLRKATKRDSPIRDVVVHDCHCIIFSVFLFDNFQFTEKFALQAWICHFAE
jgi:hypothetical protein